jgi:ferritin-like metal-binding protein YciE
MGLDRVAALLQETLDEEKKADAILTRLAETKINEQAMHTAPSH